MNRRSATRTILRLIIAGSVTWSSFCCVTGGLAWLVVSNTPNHGDDTGLGLLCIGIPLSLICAGVILFAIEREFIAPRGYFAEPNTVLRLIIMGSVAWSSFCCITGLAWLAFFYSPNHGDDAGLGVLCIAIPLSLICATGILFAFEREFIAPRGYFAELYIDRE